MIAFNRNKRYLIALLVFVMIPTMACALGPVIHDQLHQLFPEWVNGPLVHWVLGMYEEDTRVTEEPATKGVEGVGTKLSESMTVSVYKGNAGQFSTPPTVIFANYEEYRSYLDIKIHYEGIAYPFSNWLSFPDAGAWIELQTIDPVTTLGVQLWGDYEDGWVQVSVDGSPIWKGNTRFENCEFDEHGNRLVGPDTCEGGFFYYIQASGLEKTAHTIRAENIGGGSMTIYFFGVGLVKP